MESDFLVIGSGIAGLSYALRVAQLGSVVVVTKKRDIDTATNLAQGGIAAVLSKEDSYDLHEQDTLISGAGLCDLDVVRTVVREGPDRIRDLIDIGVQFVKDESDKNLSLGREGGHSRRRVAHAYDLTGREIERALLEKVKANTNIRLCENHSAVDLLIVERDNDGVKQRTCAGAYVLERAGQVVPYRAKVTTLCTGGSGKVYLYTSNPDIATGDGIAMAFRAGAKVANMEFVQFHPTCLFHPSAKNFLISEAVRGEGAILIHKDATRFMEKYDKRLELATRDTVARAIDKEMKERGVDCVYLDITARDAEFLKKRFPNIYTKCLEYGIDLTRQPIPVVPAAHYMCGGVLTDLWGRTSIEGLFALGETACTGLHGGNRLASNSLLEAVVFSERAYAYCEKNWSILSHIQLQDVDPWLAGRAVPLEEEILVNHNWDLIRRTMWNYVGIVRTTKRLELARQRMLDIATEIEQHYRDYFVTANMVELRNITWIALMIIYASLKRKESRGLHYILDFPDQDELYRCWEVFSKKEGGKNPWDIVSCAHAKKL
ncbi:MAG: L-aspartate oxidase [Desulfocapsaceae bacterium]|nr:L-aspartate oxidase [Desulfocapsaceae bacterium]